jgi:hypothetical protein
MSLMCINAPKLRYTGDQWLMSQWSPRGLNSWEGPKEHDQDGCCKQHTAAS